MNQRRTCAFALAALLLTGARPPRDRLHGRWGGVPARVELEKPYSDRGVRKMPARYTHARGHHRPDQPAHARPLPVHLAQSHNRQARVGGHGQRDATQSAVLARYRSTSLVIRRKSDLDDLRMPAVTAASQSWRHGRPAARLGLGSHRS
jgi:hypothetical protein